MTLGKTSISEGSAGHSGTAHRQWPRYALGLVAVSCRFPLRAAVFVGAASSALVGLPACGTTRLDVLRPIGTAGADVESSSSQPSGNPSSGTSARTSSAVAPQPDAASSQDAQPPPLSSSDVTGDAGGSCAVQNLLVADVHRIFLRGNRGCVQATDIQVQFSLQQHGYELALASPCPEEPSTEFSLAAMLSGDFRIASALYTTRGAPTEVLDVLMGNDDPGTRLILFNPNGLPHQQFGFVARDEGYFAIVPDHAPNQCVTYEGAQIVIEPCVLTNQDQDWQLLPLGCSPT